MDLGTVQAGPIRAVFFGETASTFSRLHLAILQKHPRVHVVLWVASPSIADARHIRAPFVSARDVWERLRLRLALEAQTLWHLRKPLAMLNPRAASLRISKLRPGPALLELLKSLQPGLLISAGFRRILPPSMLSIPRLGAFNCHPSPLPRYAGANPWFWMLSRGETESAVTIHRMVSDVDAGDIVAQRFFRISPDTNHQALYNHSSLLSALLLREWLDHWTPGAADERPQELALRSLFPAPSENDCRISWQWPAQQIVNLVRAAAPSPGAWVAVRGHTLFVRRVVAGPGDGSVPGTVTGISAAGVVVACLDGAIRIASGTVSNRQVGGLRLAQVLDISAGERLA